MTVIINIFNRGKNFWTLTVLNYFQVFYCFGSHDSIISHLMISNNMRFRVILKSFAGSGNDQVDNGIANGTLRTDIVNYLGRISSEPVTKCDKVDKLQALWQPSIASFPEEPMKSSYVNEQPMSLNANHYESPIKLRNTSMTSNSENDLRTPPNERPQSYIDMQGKKSTEMEDLLVFGSTDDKNDNNVTN